MSISSAMIAVGGLGLLLASAHPLSAQTPAAHGSSWELRVTSGALVPTGAQRNSLRDAQLTAAQVAWVVRPVLAITGTLGWARSRDVSTTASPKLDVFTTDLGVEARPAQWFARRAVTFSPFVGLGAGARSYDYRSLDVDATHNLAAYGAAGGELGMGRVGLRLEVRDYATGFKPLAGSGMADVRNDLVFTAGLRFNRKPATQK